MVETLQTIKGKVLFLPQSRVLVLVDVTTHESNDNKDVYGR